MENEYKILSIIINYFNKRIIFCKIILYFMKMN